MRFYRVTRDLDHDLANRLTRIPKEERRCPETRVTSQASGAWGSHQAALPTERASGGRTVMESLHTWGVIKLPK